METRTERQNRNENRYRLDKLPPNPTSTGSSSRRPGTCRWLQWIAFVRHMGADIGQTLWFKTELKNFHSSTHFPSHPLSSIPSILHPDSLHSTNPNKSPTSAGQARKAPCCCPLPPVYQAQYNYEYADSPNQPCQDQKELRLLFHYSAPGKVGSRAKWRFAVWWTERLKRVNEQENYGPEIDARMNERTTEGSIDDSINERTASDTGEERERKREKRRLSNAKLTKEIECTFVLQSPKRDCGVWLESVSGLRNGCTAAVSLGLDIELNCLLQLTSYGQ